MDPRWWFYAICQYEQIGVGMRADDYAAYLAGRDLDNHTETALTS